MSAYSDIDQRSILIVDDEPSNVQSLANLLKKDYKIRVAKSGEKALELARSENIPDLILLDVEMPEMDGYEVCRRLKEDSRTSGIPVIFVTARHSVEDEELGLNLGAVDYISKPFQPAIIKARVKNQINLKVKTDLLEKLSMLDGLTNIPNRRYFDEHLQREWSRTSRDGLPLSLVMLDIDHFKAYNDNYGHGAGDECLRKVAMAISALMRRPGDLAARYGGEEFAAVLPSTDEQGALQVAQGMKDAVDALRLVHEYSPVSNFLTVSLGVGCTYPGPESNTEKLLKTADQALYQSKQEGRNRISLSRM